VADNGDFESRLSALEQAVAALQGGAVPDVATGAAADDKPLRALKGLRQSRVGAASGRAHPAQRGQANTSVMGDRPAALLMPARP
jgi:hypothetical protein